MTVAPIDATGAVARREAIPAPVAITLLRQLEDITGALDLALPMFLDDTGDDPAPALGLLGALHSWTGRLRNLASLVETECARRMEPSGPYARVEGPGFYAERMPGKERKNWRRDEAVAEVVHRWLAKQTDQETGEIPREVSQTAWELRDLFLKVARPELRSTALRQLGIDPDEFSDWVPGVPRVLIRFSDQEEPTDG